VEITYDLHARSEPEGKPAPMTKAKRPVSPLSDGEEALIQRQIKSDPAAPEATDAQLAGARPFAEAHPDLAASIRRSRGRPRIESPKEKVTIRLDADLLERLRSKGPGWQGRINDLLRRTEGLP
jgi:uncharacterized protein (DUF4415 family)